MRDSTSHSTATSPVEPGDVVADKYRVERTLGSGGNGVVVVATHLKLDERVALKFLLGPGAGQVADSVRATVKLRSDHVARVFDIGRHGETPFIVMEFLDGRDLESIVQESGRLADVNEAVEIVLQACEAVAEAHRANVIHRDIKLANLLLVATRTALPRIKLLDFGVARVDTKGQAGVTMGTPHYIAPERLLGIDDDPRSDVWALGVVLYELLTGAKPFRSDNTVALIAEILEQEHVPIRQHREDLPPKLEEIIDRCLTKDPELRFQSAGDLASALGPFAPIRSQVHVERALEYGRPSAPPSSNAAIDSARRALAESSRALHASRARTTSAPPLAGRSIPVRRPRSRLLPVFGWLAAAAIVVVGVLAVSLMRKAAPADPPAPKVTAAMPATTNAQPAAPPAEPPPPPVVAPPSPSVAIAASPRILVPRAHAAHAPLPARVVTSTAPPPDPPPPPPAAPAAPAKPSIDADPWKAGAAKKPKLDDPFQ